MSHMRLEWIVLCNCLNVTEILVYNKRGIWNSSDCNKIRTHNQVVRKLPLNHLAKLTILAKRLGVCLRTNWLRVGVSLLSTYKDRFTPSTIIAICTFLRTCPNNINLIGYCRTTTFSRHKKPIKEIKILSDLNIHQSVIHLC